MVELIYTNFVETKNGIILEKKKNVQDIKGFSWLRNMVIIINKNSLSWPVNLKFFLPHCKVKSNKRMLEACNSGSQLSILVSVN